MPILPVSATGYSADAVSGGGPINGGRRAEAGDFAPDLSGASDKLSKIGEHLLARTEDDESRKAVVASAEIRAKYAKALDEAALSGAPLEPIKEQMRADLGKVSESFTTKKAVDHMAVNTANADLMFDEQANHINITRASATAKLEGAKFLNSEGAIIQSNPAYLAIATQNADAFAATLTGIRPDQKAAIADGLKKELNMAAALGASRIDPEGTKKKLDAGEWDLTPEQRNIAINKADTEVRAKRADEAYTHALDEREKHDANDAARDNLFKGIIEGKTRRRDIMEDTRLNPATREHLITFMEHRAKALAAGEGKSDPIVKRDLWLAINAPDGDPRKIYDANAIFEAVNKGKITTTDANLLNSLVANQKDENGRNIGQRLSVMSSTVGRALSQDPQFTAQPALVADIQNDYNARVLEKAVQLRKDKQDPTAIFDPNSKDYVGSRAFIQESIDKAKKTRIDDITSKMPKVNTQAEYDALPAGTPYMDSNGTVTTKKGKAKPVDQTENDPSWLRSDGSKKGQGFLGPMKMQSGPDKGKTATEISVGVNIDDKEMDIPTMVPGLTVAEKNLLLSGGRPTDDIVNKAVEHARMRMKAGKSVFAN